MKGNKLIRLPGILLLFFFITTVSCSKPRVKIISSPGSPQESFGLSKIQELGESGIISLTDGNADIIINTFLDPAALKPEAYKIETEGTQLSLTGGDATGLMYGLLEIHEQLENGKKTIANIQESPAFSFRAIKFNLPWNSYRVDESLQLHNETCRDTVFWKDFLDMMAENRFNKLTLWSLHPFNFMVKTEKYPEACGFTDAEMAGWEKFWTTLFRMAKDRGIETYIVNWNIFVSKEFALAHNVAEYCATDNYFIDKGDTSEIIKDYTRECVREVIDKYPDLTGLGVTLGEGMGGMSPAERQEWVSESFFEGMRMASRKIKFIYRAPISAGKSSGGSTSVEVEEMTRNLLDTITCTDGPVTIELKYNWSHGHSSPHLAKVHGGKLNDAYWNPVSQNYFLAWMVRNEDFFLLRWGQPEFIRKHIAENSKPWVNGYFVGSETYIPAKDYITSLEGSSYKYAFERQWMFYKTWGKLLYNPGTPDTVFEDAFIHRFPAYGKDLFSAQVKVSRVPLILASFWNATWDFTLYSEGMSTLTENDKMGIIPFSELLNKVPMDTGYLSIKQYLSMEYSLPSDKITPRQLADSTRSFCLSALRDIHKIDPGTNTDLLYEISDIRAWAYLGMYFADKMQSAIEYQRFLDGNDSAYLRKAIKNLGLATEDWQEVVNITEPIYRPVPKVDFGNKNNGYFHWSMLKPEVEEELKYLKTMQGEEAPR